MDGYGRNRYKKIATIGSYSQFVKCEFLNGMPVNILFIRNYQ